MKIREMESKLELELTTRGRLDTQIARWEQILKTLLVEFFLDFMTSWFSTLLFLD